MRSAILFALLPLGACATPAPREVITTIEVPVPVKSPCVPASLGEAPVYPDTNDTLRKAVDAAERFQLIAAGRALRQARLNELEPVVAGCPKATK